MINEYQTLIRTGDLARELGVHATTLCDWAKEASESGAKLRACQFRRGWYSIQKLREAGIVASPISSPQPAPAHGVPALSIGGIP